jgi:hypothetical protein
MRPKSIVLFEWIYGFTIVTSIVVSVWMYFTISRLMPALPPNLPVNIAWLVPIAAIAVAVFSLVIKWLLLYFIARRGSDVARWIFVVLFLLGLVSLADVVFVRRGMFAQPWTLDFSLFRTLLLAVCVWLLFRRDSAAWFRGERAPSHLHDTFS